MPTCRLPGLTLVAITLPLVGCATLGLRGGSDLRIASLETGAYLDPTPATQVYASTDENTADVLISDLPADALRSIGGSSVLPRGSILHLHMFLTPKAGFTPIDFSASNCTATLYILTGNAVGVYGGGGFLLPSGEPGGKRLSGRVAQVTLRPIEAGPAFADQLGHSELAGRIAATRDEELASAILDRLARLTPVSPVKPPAPLPQP